MNAKTLAWSVVMAITLALNLYAQSTAFTYQGRLNDGAGPATGVYDLRFALYDGASDGTQQGSAVTNIATTVSNGLFAVTLDFGAGVFTGAQRWLQISVTTNGGEAFTTLSPRQLITSTPYAVHAANAQSATTATVASSVAASNIIGALPVAQLPPSVITNGANGVNITGTFSGNGAGLTNVDAGTLQKRLGIPVAWGNNDYGQTDIPADLNTVAAIEGGTHHSLALNSDGTVIAWGNNDWGQTNIPMGLSDVVAIAAGNSFNLALRQNGTVVAWGLNGVGETDLPAGLSNVTTIAAGGNHGLALKADGTVVAWGHNLWGQADIPIGLSNVRTIAAGGEHNLALKDDGTVVAWGNNDYGQSNIPVGLSNAVAIASGYYHSLALKKDGTVVAWGAGSINDEPGGINFGQSIIPVGLTNVAAIAGGVFHSLALKQDGTIVAWGRNDYGQTTIPVGLSNVVAIAGGGSHSLALRRDVVPAPIALLNQNNAFQGTVTASAFNGDGVGLSNVNASALTGGPISPDLLPSNVVTNDANGVTLSGTFSGNGSGLTNIPFSALSGAITQAALGTSGSYIPTIGGNGNNFSTTIASGHYTKVGNLVYFETWLFWTSKGSASGSLAISLPFPVASTRAVFSLGYVGGITNATQVIPIASSGRTVVDLYVLSANGGNPSIVPVSSCANSGELQITGWYRWQ